MIAKILSFILIPSFFTVITVLSEKIFANPELKSECYYLNEPLKLMKTTIGSPPQAGQGLSDYPVRIWRGHEILAQKIWDLYFYSGQKIENLENCLNSLEIVDSNRLKLAFNAIFKEQSIQKISQINPHLIEKIKQENKTEFENFHLIAFDGNHKSNQSYKNEISNKNAGFSPASDIIFGDFANMDARDWIAIFIHELGHRLDLIDEHLEKVNNPLLLMEISKILKNEQQLSPSSEVKIDQILWSGVNIGFLAELKAWMFVAEFLAFSENTIELGPETDWLEPFLKEKDKLIRDQQIFEYLDNKFSNESNAVVWINDSRVQQRIELIRACIRDQVQKKSDVQLCRPKT